MKNETLLLKQPTISQNHIAFVYAGDIWISARDGKNPHRLTVRNGIKKQPYFSPNGEFIAYSANYDGNMCVYCVSINGGLPKRLTYHPDSDDVCGWSPDGKKILFSSFRDSISNNKSKSLFTVSLDGGLPVPLVKSMAERAAFSPDGNFIAYTQFYEPFWTWKRYRGGRTNPVWILDLETYDHVEIPHENASDTFPCWIDKKVYFLSDRCGVMNLFQWDKESDQVQQLTSYKDFDIRSLTAGAGNLAFEQAGRIHIFDPVSKNINTVPISIETDLQHIHPRYENASKYIQNCSISSCGKRAVFEARGDIFTVLEKQGSVRNLTHSSGACERFPAWSPDGKSICYFSDASGEYDLVVSDQFGKIKKTITLGIESFFYTPVWSPDNKKITFTDKALNLYVLDVGSNDLLKVDSDTYDHPERTLEPSWSPDGQWLVYTKRLGNHIRAVFLYNISSMKTYQLTDGMYDTRSACFSRDGKYIFFAASSNYGFNTGWLDMTSIGHPALYNIFAIVLRKEDKSPDAFEIDDEKVSATRSNNGKDISVDVEIDFQNLDRRIVSLPIPIRRYHNLQTAEGKLFFLETISNQPLENTNPISQLIVYDLKNQEHDVFINEVDSYWISADGKSLLYKTPDEKFAIVDLEKKSEEPATYLDLNSMDILVDPAAEWKQIYREAYRIHRDYFYDPEFHGLQLEDAYKKYLPFLDHVGHRDDLNYLLSEFTGELVVGHGYINGGDIPHEEKVSIGLLGADFEVTSEGYYRIKKLYSGVNWCPELRSPLTNPGINVSAGDYILEVNGRKVKSPENIYKLLQKTADKYTDILVNSSPDMKTARLISVKPLKSESELGHLTWVEENRKKVDALSGGQIAYIYLPDTSFDGFNSFNRYYFSQLDKKGIIIDERFNGGRSVADYILFMLERPLFCHWATREGKQFNSPNASIYGPKVMIINELAGSGGDALPHFFNQRGLGKLVGKRTWGGLVGVYDYPVLLDGGTITSPRMAIYNPQGDWEVENVGVTPDIDIEMDPKLFETGHDPQLEKAVEIALEEIKTNPQKMTMRPSPIYRALE